MIERLLALQRDRGRGVVLTVVEGDGLGTKLLVVEGGETVGDGPPELAAHAEALIRGARNRMLELEGRKVFAEVYGPPPRLLVYGAVDTAESLAAAANLLGWTTIVADARAKFATRERIPSAAELIVAWPEETFAQIAPDHATAIVILTHDDKFDLPALELALASDAFYVGLIGGRRNQEKKRERLRELGVDETSIERIAGPCGLDIGADASPRWHYRSSPRQLPPGTGAKAARSAARRSGSTSRWNEDQSGRDARAGTAASRGDRARGAVAGRSRRPYERRRRLRHRSALVQGRVGPAHADRARPRRRGSDRGGRRRGERAEGGRPRRSLVGACVRRMRTVSPRAAGRLRPARVRDRARDAARRPYRHVPRRPDRLPRHRDRRPRGASCRRRRRRDACR